MSGNGKPAGLSFSLAGAKKAAPKVQIHDKGDGGRKRELVTGFGATGALELAEPSTKSTSGPQVIPKLQDTFKTGRKGAPSFLPTSSDAQALESTEDKFEAAAPEEARQVTYGLNRMGPKASTSAAANGDGGPEPPPSNGRPSGMSFQEFEAMRLKQELQELPEVSTVDEYERMPVEEFGLALLRGMGWQEGQGVGRKREDVKPLEYVRRPALLGLGAAPAPPSTNDKKYIKPGETRASKKKDLVYVNEDGVMKHIRGIDDKLVERSSLGPRPGKEMRVVEGRHAGFDCVVLAMEPKQEGRSDRATVRLLPSEETVSVRCTELGEKGGGQRKEEGSGKRGGRGAEKEEEERQDDRRRHEDRTQTDMREGDGDGRSSKRRRGEGGDEGHRGGDEGRRGGDRGRDSRSSEGDQRRRDNEEEQKHRRAREEEEEKEVAWLAPHIRVRVVDKHLRGGKCYLKKGVVVDVAQPTLCDVHLDGSRETISGVRQSQLETVVPRAEGSRVLVLSGSLRGSVARLLKRSTESGMAAVQRASDFSVHKLSLDDIAEYVGEDDD